MADKEPTRVHLTIRVPADHVEQLDALAQIMQLERSEVARRALRNGLEDMQKQVAAGGNPVFATIIRMASLLDGSEEERREVRRLLNAIATHKQDSDGDINLEPGVAQ